MHQLQSFETWLIRRGKKKLRDKNQTTRNPKSGSLGVVSSFLIIGKDCTHLGVLGKQTQAFIIP